MHTLIIDRFEGEWAILEWEPGHTFLFPRALLPPEGREGDALVVSTSIDRDETIRRKKRIQGLLDELSSGDPGGDLDL